MRKSSKKTVKAKTAPPRRRKTPKGYISHTQIITYKRCGLQYKTKYIDHIVPEASYPMRQGSVAHTALKIIHDTAAAIVDKHPDHDPEMLSNMMDASDARSALEQALRLDSKPGEILMRDVQLMEAALVRYTEHLMQNIRGMIATEYEVPVEYKPGLNLLVVIDRINSIDEETLEIVDFKWSYNILSKSDLLEDQQLNLYAYAAKIINPGIRRFRLTHYMLRQNFPNSIEIDADQVVHVKTAVDYALEGIETGQFEPRINPYCHNCPVRGKCPAYADRFAVNHELINEVGSAHEELRDVNAKIANLDDRKVALRGFIGGEVEEKGPQEVEGGIKQWAYWEAEGSEREMKATVELFRKNGLDITPLMAITSKNLRLAADQLADRVPFEKMKEIRTELDNLCKRKVTNRLECRKV